MIRWLPDDAPVLRRYRVRLTPSPCACARCSVGVGVLWRFACWWYRTSLDILRRRRRRRHAIGSVAGFGLMLGTPGTTHADFVRLRRSGSPVLRHSPASRSIRGPRPLALGSRASGTSCRMAPLTTRVRGRLVGGFGCAVWRWAGRCRRRRPSRVPSRRAFGTGRRVRCGG